MDRTRIPTQAEVDTAKTAWQSAKTDPERQRAEAIYRQLHARRRRDDLG